MSTIFREEFAHIGQVPIAEADEEINRLEKQYPNIKWVKDFSDYLEDDNFDNPIAKLSEGYCWVVIS